jgi:steroid 5-alpha reductase family enzyme
MAWSPSWSASGSRTVYVSLYALAYAVYVGVYLAAPESIASPVWRTTLAAGVTTLVLFFPGLLLKNSNTYDVYWSVTPIVNGLLWMREYAAWKEPTAALALFVTAFWGLRLTYNWSTHFSTFDVEDWRYVDMRKKTGRAYPVASFFALYCFPFTLITLGTIPLHAAIAHRGPTPPLAFAALALGVGATVLEAISDVQLARFRRTNRDPARFMDEGLWAYSRHPNYCGEMLVWWALALFGLSVTPSYVMVLGAVGVTGMIVFASIPMADQRAVAKRPAYAEHMRRTSALFPWFRKPA